MDKLRTKEERDYYNQLKPFSRFVSPSDMQCFLNGLVREEELRKRSILYQEYRQFGLKSFADASIFEDEKKHLVSMHILNFDSTEIFFRSCILKAGDQFPELQTF